MEEKFETLDNALAVMRLVPVAHISHDAVQYSQLDFFPFTSLF